ncbi:MAG: cyclodeaminase/cyclohydrolase family protein [Planctomycetes bacterium]|nr:cyclodeaminase/cyclohydrolase family protein [Planctomycetota bacterium]
MSKSLSSLSVGEFLQQAASDAPVPGGGGIAALAAALGAAMASMAANFTLGRPQFAQHEEAMRRVLAELASLGEAFRQAIDEDARAFAGISEAYRLPKDTESAKASRRSAIAGALTDAMRVPLGVLRDCRRAAELLPGLAGAANPKLLSDVEVAAIMLEAAARAAWVNVRVNSRQLGGDAAAGMESEAGELLASVGELARKTAAKLKRNVP